MTDRKLRVFLCHASQDKPVVRELYQRLNAEGWIAPWLDEEKLLPGQDWDLEIEKAVEISDVVVVCLSDNSVSKEGYVQRELKVVLSIADYKPEGTLFVIPVRLNDCVVPRRLRMWHYVDYFPIDKKETAHNLILKSLKKRAGIMDDLLEKNGSLMPVRENLTREKIFANYKVGDVLSGRVTKILNNGVIINIDGFDAFLHKSELSHEDVQHPSEVLDIGQNISVQILLLEPSSNRINLSLRYLLPTSVDIWIEKFSKYHVGDLVEGVITHLTKFGAFARLEDDIEGWIHISQISNNRIEHPKEVLHEGDVKTLRIIRIDPEQKRIVLSLRDLDSGEFKIE